MPTRRPPDEAIGWLAVAGAGVSATTGAALTFAYRPDDLGWLRTIHSGSSAAAVVSFIAWAVVRRRGRLRFSLAGLGVVTGLVLVVGGAFATGPGLAWEGGDGSARGVLVGSGHGVTVDGKLVSGRDLAVTFAVHLVAAVCTGAAFLWQYRRTK